MSILERIPDIPANSWLRAVAKTLEDEISHLKRKCASLENRVSELERQAAARKESK